MGRNYNFYVVWWTTPEEVGAREALLRREVSTRLPLRFALERHWHAPLQLWRTPVRRARMAPLIDIHQVPKGTCEEQSALERKRAKVPRSRVRSLRNSSPSAPFPSRPLHHDRANLHRRSRS